MNSKLEIFLEWLVAVVSLPLLLLNMVGGIAALIWLAVLGQWNIVILGVLFSFFGYWLVSILLIPSMALILPVTYFAERKNIIGLSVTGFVNLAYTMAIIGGVSYCVYYTFTGNLSAHYLLPAVIWSYSAAMAPWTYMASKEDRSNGFDATTNTLYFAQLGLIVVSVLVAFFNFSLVGSFTIFGYIMIIPLLIQTIVLVLLAQKGKDEIAEALANKRELKAKVDDKMCHRCNYKNVEVAKFCKECGIKLDDRS